MKRNIASLIAFAASTALAFSQVQIKVGSALKISESITIDGALSEAVWRGAQDFTDFIQFEPERGKPASLKTTVRILYDERNIYLGFPCYDPKPELLAASQSKRYSDLRIDDSVAVCLDTFYDKRNCYYFMTNLLS